MKLDYKYLKNMLLIMEGENNNNTSCYNLFKKMEIPLNEVENDEKRDKIIGHLMLLEDNNYIESDLENLGFNTGGSNTHIGISEANYRITMDGYEFLKMLKNDTIFNAIKDSSINMAFEIGKAMLTEKIRKITGFG